MTKKSNTEEFKAKANIKHNFKYTYDKVNYVDNSTKIIITCLIHGDFEQRPVKHLQGHGCHRHHESAGERETIKNLINLNIKFERQKF